MSAGNTPNATASTTALYGNHAEFGEPADADASDDYILRRTEFSSSFNRVRNIPNWVSYNLDPTHFGPEDRRQTHLERRAGAHPAAAP